MNTLVASIDRELYEKSKEELESYWYFKYDTSISVEENMYSFHSMLHLYSTFCRRWEEYHNGSYCVVERVRDTYIMPKIRLFCKNYEKLY